MKILQINASARSTGASSTRVADVITARLQSVNPNATVEKRDLAADPHPVLDEFSLGAMFTPADKRSAEQNARIALNDALIAQLKSADVIVLGVPMYNFGVSVQFKSWIDAVARAGDTFRYTENGPIGLVTGKKVYIGIASGGIHYGTPTDSMTPYLKTVLGFLGMTDVEFVHAEALAFGPEAVEKSFSQVDERVKSLIA